MAKTGMTKRGTTKIKSGTRMTKSGTSKIKSGTRMTKSGTTKIKRGTTLESFKSRPKTDFFELSYV